MTEFGIRFLGDLDGAGGDRKCGGEVGGSLPGGELYVGGVGPGKERDALRLIGEFLQSETALLEGAALDGSRGNQLDDREHRRGENEEGDGELKQCHA